MMSTPLFMTGSHFYYTGTILPQKAIVNTIFDLFLTFGHFLNIRRSEVLLIVQFFIRDN